MALALPRILSPKSRGGRVAMSLPLRGPAISLHSNSQGSLALHGWGAPTNNRQRQLVSVANLTRHDAVEFFGIVPEVGIVTETVSYQLTSANQALSGLRAGRLQGAAVLVP